VGPAPCRPHMGIEDRVSEQRTRGLRCGFKRWLELGYCIRNGGKAIQHPGAGHRQGTRPAERRGARRDEAVSSHRVRVRPSPTGGPPVGAGGARSAERARDRRLGRPPAGSAAGIAEALGSRFSFKSAPGRATGATHRRHSQVRGELKHRPRRGCETIPYVAGWWEDGALDAVTKFAETIESVARRIEDARSHHGHDAAWVAHCPLEPLGIRNEPGLDGRDLVRAQVRWVVRSSARRPDLRPRAAVGPRL
jgi:hypothetical protein